MRAGEQLASHDDKFALSSSDFLLLPQHLVTISISFHFLFYPHGAFAGNGVKWIIESRQTTTKNRSHRSTKLRGTIDADCLLRPSRKSAAAEGKFPVITVRIYIKFSDIAGRDPKWPGAMRANPLRPMRNACIIYRKTWKAAHIYYPSIYGPWPAVILFSFKILLYISDGQREKEKSIGSSTAQAADGVEFKMAAASISRREQC